MKANVNGLIGIYSPVHRIGKTRFAMRMGRVLSESIPTLYLNLEGYSGLNYYLPEESGMNLGDLLYYMKQESINPVWKISTLISHMNGVDYIAPIRAEQDFREVTKEEWNQLLDLILEKSIYKVIILDLGDTVDGLYDLLGRCSKVYTPYIEEGAAKYNIFVSGGTGAGKTTFLNALSNYIPKGERLITIEDNAELQIQGVQNLVRLEARGPNAEGEGAVTIRDLIKSALRMRPDRIVVGEVRGEETVDMISSAMLNGHSGSMSTGHANNPTDMLHRLETMMLMGIDLPLQAIQRQVASALDIIIHLGRLRDKTRKVLQIVEVEGYEDGRIQTKVLYEFKEEGMKNGKIQGCLMKKNEITNKEKLLAAGYHTI